MTPTSDDKNVASMVVIPAGTEASMRIKPVTNVNILINHVGVGFAQLLHALSISNALTRKAPPRILTNTAKISAV